MPRGVISGISPRFRGLSQSQRQVAHVLLTRSPLEYPRRGLSARLACVKHAASVRPEPGSNSPTKTLEKFAPATKMSPKEPQPEKIWHGNKIPKSLWHWHHKHPVEFSKDNHTPTRSNLDQTSVGATPQRYPVEPSPSIPKFWNLQGWAPAGYAKAI